MTRKRETDTTADETAAVTEQADTETGLAQPACTRREFGTAAAVAPVAPMFISRADTDSMTPLLEDGVGFRSFEAHERAILYGSAGHPGVTVWYDTDHRDSLLGDDESWVESDDSRRLIRHHADAGVATVAAPAEDLGLGGHLRAADGLIQFDWIEQAELDIRYDLIDPVSPASADEVPVIDRSDLSRFERRRLDPVDADGIAYGEDFEKTMVGEARAAMDADSDALGTLPDTSGLLIAVVDTGVNHADGAVFGTEGTGSPRLHPASTDYVSDGEPTVGEDGLDAVADPEGHGTHVASTMAADPDPTAYPDGQGFLPDADVLAQRALGSDGSGSASDIATAIRDAADEGADVICLSLGAPMQQADVVDALEYAVDAGSVPVAATGNDRERTTWQASPASSEDALGVAATTVAAPETAQSAYFSNIGPNPGTTDFSEGATAGMQPDFGAPGTDLGAVVADDSGNVSTRYLSGTSMATPCTGGVAGLLIASGVTGFESVQERLSETAEPISAAATNEVGHGLPSAANGIDNTEPDETQADARDDDAVARDDAYQSYSDVHGRRFAVLFL